MSNISNIKVNIKVTAVTIIFGDRWRFLSQVIAAVMDDPHISRLIIVDNGSKNSKEIEEGVKKYGDKITVVHHEKNLGSAGGFAAGLSLAKNTDCDFVFMLDDDSVPEKGAVGMYLDVLALFPDEKVVLSGNRCDILQNREYFYKQSIKDDTPRFTFFEVFSMKKILHFIFLFGRHKNEKVKRGPFTPVIPTEGFVYGGAFIPIRAVREAPLPDASLFLYCDDIEYSWNIKKLGYKTYLTARPYIHDIDATFGSNSSHLLGQFELATASFKVYYRIRNMVRLSVKHSTQSRSVLFLNIFFWMLGLYILGLFKFGPTKIYCKRVKLMTYAVYAGYVKTSSRMKSLEASFFNE
jgi:GT2 family glycosyltransferase